MNFKIVSLLLAITLSISCSTKNQWELLSPDKNIKIKVVLEDSETEVYGSLFYEASIKKDGEFVTVIKPSPLGLIRDDEDLASALKFVKISEVRSIDETYEMISGKKRIIHNQANEMSITFSNSNDVKLQIDLHSANDGVAFRYILPGEGEKVYTINGEETGFSLPEGTKTWIPTYGDPQPWSPGYETYYTNGEPVEDAPVVEGWSFPAMFNTNDCWVLISETGPYNDYVAVHLEQKVENNTYKVKFPEKGERNSEGVTTASSTLPWTMPWRFIIIGDELNDIVQSTMVYNLAEPCKLENTDWIKPGRASWSWWSSKTSGRKYDTLVAFCDMAADFGWEYTLVDAAWEKTKGGDIEDFIEYSNKKNVGVILWYNSGGRITKPFLKDSFKMAYPNLRKKELKRIHDLGVKGIKVDFFNGDKQHIMQLYQDILKDAAKYEILVNFHGCTLPRGWTRTYPHLLTQEAIRGGESYRYDSLFPENSPWHNTIAFFVRGTVGPMDYGPVMLSNQKFAHKSTYAHELATSVLLESGIVHFADKVESYYSLDDDVKKVLSEIPTVWEDIQLIDGYPGEWVLVNRKTRDNKWYIICTNGKNENKEVSFKLSFLEDGKDYSMKKVTDKDAKTINVETVTVKNGDEIIINTLPYGGFILIVE